MLRVPRSPILRVSCLACAFGVLATAVAGLMSSGAVNAADKGKSPITKLTYDPAAEKVDLFEAMDSGTLEVTIIAKDAMQGSLLIENKSDKPVSVKVPDSFVGVPVLKQFGGTGAGFGGTGSQGGGQSGGSQPFGGGGGGAGGGQGLSGGGAAPNFFSVPAEKVVKVPYTSVCLAHGKAEPRPRSNYKLIRTEEFTKDATLQELVRLVGTGRMDPQSAQAAAWHLTDKMSWQDLLNKKIHYLGGQGDAPYFSQAQIARAQSIVAQAQGNARERSEKTLDTEPTPVRTSRTR